MGIESSREAGDARQLMPARAQSIMLGAGIAVPGPGVLEEVSKDIRKLWLGPLVSLPVGKDLPRLIRRMVVFQGESTICGELVSSSAFGAGSEPTSPLKRVDSSGFNSVEDEIYHILHNVFSMLRNLLDPDRPPLPDEPAFRSDVHLDDHSTLTNWISKNIGEESREIGVLKACNQAILAPAITRLKRELISHSSIRFKDVPGGWRIHIHLDEDPAKAPWVAHRRREQVLVQRPPSETDGPPNDMDTNWAYQFEWELRLVFNRSVQRLPDVKILLVDIDFTTCNGAECLPESERESQEKAFKKALNDVLSVAQAN